MNLNVKLHLTFYVNLLPYVMNVVVIITRIPESKVISGNMTVSRDRPSDKDVVDVTTFHQRHIVSLCHYGAS